MKLALANPHEAVTDFPFMFCNQDQAASKLSCYDFDELIAMIIESSKCLNAPSFITLQLFELNIKKRHASEQQHMR